jgi:hypothetical protein
MRSAEIPAARDTLVISATRASALANNPAWVGLTAFTIATRRT